MVDCNGRSGLSLLIESALIEQNVDEYASIFFTFSQIKQFATQKQFRKFNRQYLKNQQTVLSLPDSPCQTVLNYPKTSFDFFWLFIHPCLGVYHGWYIMTQNMGVDHEWYIMTRNVGVVQVRRRSRNPNQRMAKWSSPLTTLFPVSTNTQRRLQKTTIVNKWGLKLNNSTWPLSKYCIRSKFPTQSSVA